MLPCPIVPCSVVSYELTLTTHMLNVFLQSWLSQELGNRYLCTCQIILMKSISMLKAISNDYNKNNKTNKDVGKVSTNINKIIYS